MVYDTGSFAPSSIVLLSHHWFPRDFLITFQWRGQMILESFVLITHVISDSRYNCLFELLAVEIRFFSLTETIQTGSRSSPCNIPFFSLSWNKKMKLDLKSFAKTNVSSSFFGSCDRNVWLLRPLWWMTKLTFIHRLIQRGETDKMRATFWAKAASRAPNQERRLDRIIRAGGRCRPAETAAGPWWAQPPSLMRNESACFLTISTNRYTCNKHALSPSDEWPGLGRERENVERGGGGWDGGGEER